MGLNMKDPCEDNCILRAVCTEVCSAKENYGVLIVNAIEQNSIYKKNRNRKVLIGITPKYEKWIKRADKFRKDIINIQNRKIRKEGTDV